MSFTVRVKWEGDDFMKEYFKREKTYFHALGLATNNQMSELAHKDSGTLRNSMTYKLADGTGNDFSTKHGEGKPPQDAKVSKPTSKRKIRTGSALVYAKAQERHNAWASKSYDRLVKFGTPLYIKVMRF